MKKSTYISGALLGIIVPFIGIFVGLQVSTTLGTILALPFIGLSYVTGSPFGTWGWGMLAIAALISIVVWTAIVALVQYAFAHVNRKASVPPSVETKDTPLEGGM